MVLAQHRVSQGGVGEKMPLVLQKAIVGSFPSISHVAHHSISCVTVPHLCGAEQIIALAKSFSFPDIQENARKVSYPASSRSAGEIRDRRGSLHFLRLCLH